ncbi:CCA tRNA nucleotidyltransferase [Rickettsia endosymbiont of Culicoides newsteadi]|uniref:CCA tRNA nucleotidyltransferase n=1 Tax=Rickettsia endosymbiont of Culicoides newsteadi TaxID=1961830 RepID=UPI000B9A5A50|nr:CCA tRNA nucleotidyltransferase [Rickettsia endosymbiont of Culicoides newsteadi]OZG32093.1 poly(A) polymerase [Rickettsia endosymbiont of Culicoides newsteadi]
MNIITRELSIQSNYYKEILSIIRLGGGMARVVGGAVRDAILNVVNYDIDIATNLLPQQVTDILSAANIKVIPTGIKYGTVTALLNNETFEITTLRKDMKCDGRHTEVVFTDDFMEDAARRDFTINALSYCPFEHKIYDYFGGIDDLQQSKVIFIGQAFARIQEDFLRILRFFRFSCYYARQLDLNGLDACIKLQENLKLLSKERVKWEMDKLIISDNSPNILQQMFDNGILQIILPVSKFDKKPLMEAINCGSLEPYARYSLLFYHIKNLSLSDLLNLKFSRQQANKIITIYRFINQEINEFTLREIWWETADYPANYLQCINILLSLGKLNRATANKFLDTYKSKPRPIFPVNGHDLQKINIHGKDIGTVIGKLKKSWIASDFTLSKHQLLELYSNDLKN